VASKSSGTCTTAAVDVTEATHTATRRVGIDASVRIEGEDRAGRQRLLRYCARPPFALERLRALAGVASLASPDARLLYRFPKPTPDWLDTALLQVAIERDLRAVSAFVVCTRCVTAWPGEVVLVVERRCLSGTSSMPDGVSRWVGYHG
jgi:hypothetical protein